MASTQEGNRVQWFVMRDLKRSNAKLPAYKLLREEQFEVFVPMKWELVNQNGIKVRRELPVFTDLLFVRATKEELDPIVEKTETIKMVVSSYRIVI